VLRVTTNAAQMIQDLTTEADLPTGGLRIAQQRAHPGLTMELAPEPAAHDAVLRQKGVQLFLDPVAARRLRRQVLDARRGENGAAFFLDR
jgi:Fe-S cluster assembly iron-binding protein IscA